MAEIIEAFFHQCSKFKPAQHMLSLLVSCASATPRSSSGYQTVLLSEQEHKWWKVRGLAANKFEELNTLRPSSSHGLCSDPQGAPMLFDCATHPATGSWQIVHET